MSSVTAKTLVLSQPKAGQSESIPPVILPHTTCREDQSTNIKVEVPGIDPSTVEVNFDNNILRVECERGEFSTSIDPTVDISKIKADIHWGMLTLTIPAPPQPAARSIKVSVHDATPAPVKKPAAKTHVATEEE